MMMATAVIISISATFFMLAVFSILRRLFVGHEQNLSGRLAEISTDKSLQSSEIPMIIRNDDLSQIPLLNRLLNKLQVSENLRRLLVQADLSMKVGNLVLLMLVIGGLGLLFTLRSGNIVLMVFCFVLFSSLPLAYVLFRRRRRLNYFEEQFPDALDMMSNATKAGFAFGKAIELVAKEAPDPVGLEFMKTFEEINLGLPMKDALMNLTHRLDSIDLRLFVTAILIQRESGGNLTEMLTKIGSTIRARFKLFGQIKVFTAQGRMSLWILGSLPIALGLIIGMTNPDYIMLLFRETLGHYMLAFGLTLQLLGVIIIRKIVRIKIH